MQTENEGGKEMHKGNKHCIRNEQITKQKEKNIIFKRKEKREKSLETMIAK